MIEGFLGPRHLIQYLRLLDGLLTGAPVKTVG